MSDPSTRSVLMRQCLQRLQEGDDRARDELVNRACDQLKRLTRGLLRTYPAVRRWEETDDVLQNAALRLWQALREVRPRSLAEFFGLAALQVRRELIDLARSLGGPEGLGAHHASGHAASSGSWPPLGDQADTTYEPSSLAGWTEFHEQIETLPPEEREVFDLLWYHDLTQTEAAEILGVTERTIRKRWRAARLRMAALFNRDLPSSG